MAGRRKQDAREKLGKLESELMYVPDATHPTLTPLGSL
jgi:hypothetical protein